MHVVCRDAGLEAWDALLHRVHQFNQQMVLAEHWKSE